MRRAEARLRRYVAACRIQAAVRGWRVRRAMAIAKQARVPTPSHHFVTARARYVLSLSGPLSHREQHAHESICVCRLSYARDCLRIQ